MSEYSITTLRSLLEADNAYEAAVRAWQANPADIKSLRDMLARGARTSLNNARVFDIETLTDDMVASREIRELLTQYPVTKLTRGVHRLNNVALVTSIILSNRHYLYVGNDTSSRGNARAITVPRVLIITYNPGKGFFVVARGSSPETNEIVDHASWWDKGFYSFSTPEILKSRYGKDLTNSNLGWLLDGIPIYVDRADPRALKYLERNIRAGR